ncbi:hypothetical protein K7X08_032091 [Anisodus acutangulus]|uniref:Uncharacterized protein n=1 Tax=Anisodus acutangulus TaxID=402998 RepID=A0A9Q1MRB2_9SOLA|nr:hypothetical protein K7X08_032091 [Anisodus acutangulus]
MEMTGCWRTGTTLLLDCVADFCSFGNMGGCDIRCISKTQEARNLDSSEALFDLEGRCYDAEKHRDDALYCYRT